MINLKKKTERKSIHKRVLKKEAEFKECNYRIEKIQTELQLLYRELNRKAIY